MFIVIVNASCTHKSSNIVEQSNSGRGWDYSDMRSYSDNSYFKPQKPQRIKQEKKTIIAQNLA